MFSGMGGFEKGLEGHECIGMSEINKYANMVLKYKFPKVINYGDATKINPYELPEFDMLCGGVPCQSWSIAGKRKGFDDERGNMWFEVFRIAKVKKPKYLLLENVKGLLSHDNGKSFELLCEKICEIGYAIDFTILNSKNFGVPQNRERVFILAIRKDLLSKDELI